MNFMNRKLFRGRAARDKLNKMGGIMASSQPLMNTVQNFQVGGNVRSRYVPGQGYPARPIPGTRPTVFGFGSGDLPTATDIMQSGLGQFIAKNLPTAANARRKITNIQEFIKPARTAIGDFMTERDQRRAGGIETTRGPTAEDLKPVLPLTSSEEALQAGQIPTMRGPTAADAREGAQIQEGGVETLRGPTAADIRDYAGQRTAGGVETLRGPTAEDAPETQRRESDRLAGDILGDYSMPSNEEEGMGEGVLSGFTMITGEEQPTTKSGAEKPAPAPVTVTKSGLQASGEAIKNTTDQLAEFLGSSKASETEKNDAILEQFGYKSPEEDIKGLKKRAELNAQLYRDIAGVDPEEDKKIDGYNLAMMGFMIAAGDSPDALQNIAAGMAKGTSMMMDTKKARQERDRQFKVAGLDKAIQDDEKRKQLAIDAYNKTQDRRFSLLTDQLKNQQQQQLVMIQLSAKEDMLKTELQAKRDLVNDQNLSAEARARYAADVGVLEKQIAGLGPFGAMAVAELGIARALEGDNFGNKVDEILNDPTKLAQAQSIAGMSKTAKTGPQAMTPERFAQELMTDQKWVESTTYAILEDLKAQGIENPTQTQINTELRNRAGQQASTPITSAAPPAQERPTVTTEAEFDALPPGTEFIQNGQVRMKPAQ